MLHFGDNLANFKPIEHLYKTDVIKIARLLNSRDEVINQSPSAGFWENQEDLEDIAYWIINEGPIIIPKQFNDMEIAQAEKIAKKLSWEKLDMCLKMISKKEDIENIVRIVELPIEIINGIIEITKKAKKYKSRKILVSLRKEDID